MNIEPLHSNLLVEPFQLGEISRGGLLIPQVAKASTPYRYGKVLATGPGRYSAAGTLIPVAPKPGDIIAYAKGQGVPMPLDDENGVEREVLILNEQFVVGIVRDLPEQSRLSGLDGRLLTMQPGSRARADGAYEALESLARAKQEGFLDSSGTMLDDMETADTAEAEAD